jgi:hypothetical protein
MILRKLLFLFVLFACQTVSAQFTDDFTDGDFTLNPIWSGDNALFTVTANELNSQSPVANNYYLSTPSAVVANGQWDFFFNMKFGTSGVNFVDVYLMSDVADVTNPNDGYFVRIGGTLDEVSLYKIVGGTPTILIDGPDGDINNTTNNPFDVRVTRDLANNWTLFYDDGAAGSLVSIGSIVDNSVNTSSFFGIAITQSGATSAVNNHFFDNFSVTGTVFVDNVAPTLDSLVIQSATTLDAYFNEPVGLVTAQTLANYSVDLGIGNPSAALRDALDSTIVHLTFGTSFTSGQNYNLTVNNVEDTLFNNITTIVEPFTYVVVIMPSAGDVVINEIFADPSPQLGLPAEEFVELYNASNNTFVLSNWQFINSTTAKILPNYILNPNSYVILCDINDTGLYTPFGDVIGVSGFSALTNGGDSLSLTDNNNNVLDIVKYDISWYQDNIKDDGGWTLERINPLHPCSNTNNWIASSNPIGGTPGTQNSVFNTAPDTQAPTIASVNIISTTEIKVLFSETMDSTSLANATYTFSGVISVTNIVVDANNQGVTLTLNPALDSSIVYTLTILGANDCSGNIMTLNTNDFGIGKAPTKYEIVINELFADPSPTNGLPTEDYLELFNNTTKIIDLTNCWIADLTSMNQLNAGKILPGEHVIICDNSFENQFSPFGKVITVNSFPSLNNSEDEITLYSPDTSFIHQVHYFDTWYRDDNKKDGGWSIEMIDPSNPCGEADNWIASTKWFGGTPGTQNTAFGANPDVILPQLNEANALNDSTVIITFNEIIDNDGMLAAIYNVNNGITIANILVLDSKNVQLNLITKLVFQTKYTVTVTGAFDCVGNTIGSNNFAIFALPEQGFSGDLVINEALFNPYTGGSDFIEVYNNSNKFIDLQNWSLANLESDSIDNYKTITTTPKLLLPGEFALLTKDAQNISSEYFNAVSEAMLQIESLPTYSNDEGHIFLINNLNMVVDSFHYNDDMHFPLLNETKGVSLERIDYNRLSNDVTNWHSASEQVGFATPGYENSQYLIANNDGGEVTTSPETFSPDNDGVDDVLNISYVFSEPGMVANIVIYDAKGRLSRNLIKNELLGTSGTFSWDGINENNEKARIGIYIIYFEAFDVEGNVKSFKNVVVLAGQL